MITHRAVFAQLFFISEMTICAAVMVAGDWLLTSIMYSDSTPVVALIIGLYSYVAWRRYEEWLGYLPKVLHLCTMGLVVSVFVILTMALLFDLVFDTVPTTSTYPIVYFMVTIMGLMNGYGREPKRE